MSMQTDPVLALAVEQPSSSETIMPSVSTTRNKHILATNLISHPSSPRSTLDNPANRTLEESDREKIPDTRNAKSNAFTQRNAQESKSADSEKGILFGRGSSIQERPQNIHFRRVVDAFKREYKSASQSKRTKVVCKVIELLRQDGYSFLKPHPPANWGGVDESNQNCGFDNAIVVEEQNSWTLASTLEVQNEVTQLLRRFTSRRSGNGSSDGVHGIRERKQEQRQAVDLNIVNGFKAPVPAIGTLQHQNSHQVCLSTQSLMQHHQQVPQQNAARPSPWIIPHLPLLHDQLNLSAVQLEETSEQASHLLQMHRNTDFLPEPSGSVLRKDRLLWSKGSKSISLLEGMDSKIIPTTSYSLIPAIEDQTFGKDAHAEPSQAPRNDDHLEEMGSKTIGYTHQKVGHVTIVRPIVLLPNANRVPSNSARWSNDERTAKDDQSLMGATTQGEKVHSGFNRCVDHALGID